MHLNPGKIIVGRYEVIEQIGIGGMAIVYRAKDLKLDRFVTLKVMREEFVEDDEFIARFSVEARAAASLNNQNIVSVFDVGQEGDIHFIVMEYIDGFTLKDLIKRRAPFENDQMLGVAIQIANAIDHAHSNQIIHRDIKPQNIMVTSTGIVKVTDFGIARAASNKTLTVATNVMGSVHYFSPEQARGGFVDNKSDIYSLGIVMYEMATGHLPYNADEAVSVALMHLNEPLPDIRQYNPNISESIIRIINKATDKVSSKRYQTAFELCADLKRALTDSTGNFVVEHEVLEAHTKKLSYDPKLTELRARYAQQREISADRPRVAPTNKPIANEGSEKSMERKIITYAILTAVAIVCIISALFFLGGAPSNNEPTPIDLPNFKGMTMVEARDEAKKLGITISVTEQQPDDSYPADTIISFTAPDKVYPGDEIKVVTSSGSSTYPVPSVINKDYNEALKEFKDLPFDTPKLEFVFDDNVPLDVVISQEPTGGKHNKNTIIKLKISKGPENKMVKVPRVTNLTEAEAIEIIQSENLVVGLSSAQHETIPVGVVISQSPEYGTEVMRNSTVSIVISSGPPPSPSPTASAAVTKTLPVDLDVPEDSPTVHLKILELTSGGQKVLLNQEIETNRFPFDLPVTGEGIVIYHFYFVDEDGVSYLQAEHQINFSKESENE